ncbi:helix-turn-helix domain-containing protein [Polaromonas sp.]|uniref:helix-turn-helix domain-containing protein n=1 Tax=Polaromonas sp. TaxID=1869339 RepID=UPI00375310EF
MSDFDGQGPGNAAVPMEESARGESTATPLSAGTLLRQAREAAGLHIAALAVALKVPVKKLEALESDRLDLLPDAVFVRALASSVCRTLKLDAAPVLALLPQTGKPRLDHQKTSINTPFRSPSDGPGPSLWAQVSRPAVLAGLLLLLGALVMIFLPAVQQQEMAAQPLAGPAASTPQATSASVSASPAQVQESPSPASSESPVVTAAPTGVMSATPATAPGLSAGSALLLPAASPADAPAATSVQTTTSSATVAGGLIVFTAKGESWVEVTDAKGVVVLRRTLAAGEVAGASGVLPLAAVVGRVDATQVQVRGRAFDLGAVAKDNVARFEVK